MVAAISPAAPGGCKPSLGTPLQKPLGSFHVGPGLPTPRPFFLLTRVLLFAAALSGGPPPPGSARGRLPASPADGRPECGPAPALLQAARACCVARRAETRPSGRRLASHLP